MDPRFESLGNKWYSLVGGNGDIRSEAMAYMKKVVEEGGTRDAWNVTEHGNETVMLAWPEKCPLRAAVIVHGPADGEKRPVTVLPFMEGIAQDMTVEGAQVWSNGVVAYVAACRNEGARPLVFQNLFYYRDRAAMSTPGVRHTFLLSGMAVSIRKAVLDELTITDGPAYEEYAGKWLEANPGKTRLDVPQLRIDLRGQSLLQPGEMPGDYQMRGTVSEPKEEEFDGKKFYMLPFVFGEQTENPLTLLLYVPAAVCGDYVPRNGDEVDAMFWLQGRLID